MVWRSHGVTGSFGARLAMLLLAIGLPGASRAVCESGRDGLSTGEHTFQGGNWCLTLSGPTQSDPVPVGPDALLGPAVLVFQERGSEGCVKVSPMQGITTGTFAQFNVIQLNETIHDPNDRGNLKKEAASDFRQLFTSCEVSPVEEFVEAGDLGDDERGSLMLRCYHRGMEVTLEQRAANAFRLQTDFPAGTWPYREMVKAVTSSGNSGRGYELEHSRLPDGKGFDFTVQGHSAFDDVRILAGCCCIIALVSGAVVIVGAQRPELNTALARASLLTVGVMLLLAGLSLSMAMTPFDQEIEQNCIEIVPFGKNLVVLQAVFLSIISLGIVTRLGFRKVPARPLSGFEAEGAHWFHNDATYSWGLAVYVAIMMVASAVLIVFMFGASFAFGDELAESQGICRQVSCGFVEFDDMSIPRPFPITLSASILLCCLGAHGLMCTQTLETLSCSKCSERRRAQVADVQDKRYTKAVDWRSCCTLMFEILKCPFVLLNPNRLNKTGRSVASAVFLLMAGVAAIPALSVNSVSDYEKLKTTVAFSTLFVYLFWLLFCIYSRMQLPVSAESIKCREEFRADVRASRKSIQKEQRLLPAASFCNFCQYACFFLVVAVAVALHFVALLDGMWPDFSGPSNSFLLIVLYPISFLFCLVVLISGLSRIAKGRMVLNKGPQGAMSQKKTHDGKHRKGHAAKARSMPRKPSDLPYHAKLPCVVFSITLLVLFFTAVPLLLWREEASESDRVEEEVSETDRVDAPFFGKDGDDGETKISNGGLNTFYAAFLPGFLCLICYVSVLLRGIWLIRDAALGTRKGKAVDPFKPLRYMLLCLGFCFLLLAALVGSLFLLLVLIPVSCFVVIFTNYVLKTELRVQNARAEQDRTHLDRTVLSNKSSHESSETSEETTSGPESATSQPSTRSDTSSSGSMHDSGESESESSGIDIRFLPRTNLPNRLHESQTEASTSELDLSATRGSTEFYSTGESEDSFDI